MALKSGFYNAKYNSSTGTYDRVYDANDMSIIASMLVNDGIFVADANHFQVTPGSAQREVLIAPGKAFFRNKWVYNDSAFSLVLPSYSGMNNTEKWDAIVIDLNIDETSTSDGARTATFKVVSSPDSADPVRPIHSADYPNGGTHMVNNRQVTFLAYNGSTHFQYPIAYVRRRASQTSIPTGDIYGVVGQSEYKVPGVSYVVDPGSKIDDLYRNWVADWNAFLTAKENYWTNTYIPGKDSAWTTFLNGKTSAWNTWFGASANAGVRKTWSDWFSETQSDYSEFKENMEEWAEEIDEIVADPTQGISTLNTKVSRLESKIGNRSDNIIVLGSNNYGDDLPATNKILGRLFFRKVTG